MILSEEEKTQALDSMIELARTLDIQHIGMEKPVLLSHDPIGVYGTDSHVRVITIVGVVKQKDRSHEIFDMPTMSVPAEDVTYEVTEDEDDE